MDVMIHNTNEGIVFTAISGRAILYFEDRLGRHTKQIVVAGNPEDVLGRFPRDYIIKDAGHVN